MSSQEYSHDIVQLYELFSMVGVGVWDWKLTKGIVVYSPAWTKILGYTIEELPQTITAWQQSVLPEDLVYASKQMDRHLFGESPMYEAQYRMKCKNGDVIWVLDKGQVTEYDKDGKAIRFMGVLQDVTPLKNTENRLLETLESLENNHISMESEVKRHSIEMADQGRVLWTVSQISRNLLAVLTNGNFRSLMQDCLRLLGESIGKSRVYIWKDRTRTDGRTCCRQIYEWVSGTEVIQSSVQWQEIYYEDLPAFDAAIDGGRCLNSLIRNLSDSERRILGAQDIQSILIAPMTINGRRWGFIGVDNCESEQLFTSVEEDMLLMSGSLLANAIEKMETEKALREMEERTQIMLNATPLCCNLWTADFKNMMCNDEAVRLFELSSQEEYLERFFELSPECQPNGRRSDEMSGELILKTFQEGYCRFEWLHQKLDGTPIPAEITLVRIKYKDGFIVAGYTRDLREQQAMLAEIKTKESLRVARDEALLNSKAKSNFLANMSHEIRTPMNAISGFAEIILRESESGKTMEYANGIKSACGNLINIVNDILDISKIESGKLEIFDSSYDVASMLNDVIIISRMRLGDKPLMFTTEIDSRLPAQLVGDESRIRQILLNLLSNAIKYTQEGFVELRVLSRIEGDKATLEFTVEDSGCGIKPENLERLFEEFERVNTKKNRSVEGTGLGLAISRRLCEMMGGHIGVESTYGEGSEFVAVIPQGCPSYQPLAQVKEEKSVLLYEPRERYRLSIVRTLNNLKCRCTPCANQSDLYNSIGAAPYDYILTAGLHLKKVQEAVLKNELPVPVAAFADYGEKLSDDKVYTILFPVNCLQVSALLNGLQEDERFTKRNAASIHFAAPSARVLVVDDNPVNLQVAKGLMKPYEFMIDTAENGVEAVRMVKDTRYDLVFMDHMMPEMDGVDATVAIRKLAGEYYQTLPIIALTANALVGTKEIFIKEGMNDYLAKPIEINKLAHILIKWLPKSKIKKSKSNNEAVIAEQEDFAWNLAGVNTEQGILSVGGSKENYLQILSAYYADGRQKCFSLPEHILENNIAAFRTEIHAIKSISATIGAIKISSMAEKLEAAAQNHNKEYIENSIEEFLTCFREVLEVIRPILPPGITEQIPEREMADSRLIGDHAYLEEVLRTIKAAAEYVDIASIEADLLKLWEFTWSEEIRKELEIMCKKVTIFDYDAIYECAVRLESFL